MNIDFSEVLNKFEPKGISDLLIGVDKNGKLHSHDFFRRNNLLISGQTGSGKTLTIHQMILSGMFNKSPKDIQFAFYDPTRVDYFKYNNSPFLMKDIMHEAKELKEHLIELAAIIDKRQRQFLDANTVDIEEYNKYAIENDLEPLPYIMTIIDEISIAYSECTEIEEHLIKAIYPSRLGISFIIGTQTPKRGVITSTLKSNIDCRIAMKLFNKTESMIAIDEVGAEQLNGRGEMLYKGEDGRGLELLQGAYVSNDNIKTLCDYFNTKYSM